MIEDFVKTYNQNREELSEIGRGGNGTVYFDPKFENALFKVSLRMNVCRSFNTEYAVYNDMQDKRDKIPESITLVKVIELYEYSTFTDEKDNEGCVLALQRIRPLVSNKHNKSIHATFGDTFTEVSLHLSRGYYYGLKELEKHLSNVSEYIFQLGQMMATLHYILLNDGYDIEVIVGYEHNSDVPRLYIIDFDLSKTITEFDSGTIKRIVDGLTSVPYFPYADDPNWKIFSDGYLSIAEKEDYSEVAEQVLSKYAEY